MTLIDKETIEQKANRLLEESVIYYNQKPVGAVAATDSEREALNYDQCFTRDFIPAAKGLLNSRQDRYSL